MYDQRLQILVSSEQRRRLEEEAERRGVSVSGLIREAVDRQLGSVGREHRVRAVDAIRRLHGTFLTPDELERLLAEGRTDGAGP